MDGSISRSPRGVVVDLDPVAVLALEGLLEEVFPLGVDVRADVAAVVAQVRSCLHGPILLVPVGALEWMRVLCRVRSRLAQTLALEACPRAEVASLAADLAAGSPVETSARAFVWVGVLLEELASALVHCP